MIRYISILLSVCISLASCTKEIDLNINHKQPKLVLNTILEPNAPASIHVSHSAPVNSGKISHVNNATVIIFENGTPIDTLTRGWKGVYRFKSIVPKPGFRYKFRVTSPEYGTAEGETTIPARPSSSALQIKKWSELEGPVGDEWNKTMINVTYSVADNPTEANFYGLAISEGRGNDTTVVQRFNPNTNTWEDSLIFYRCETAMGAETFNALVEFKDGIVMLGFDGTPSVRRVEREKDAIVGEGESIRASMFWLTDKTWNGTSQKFNFTFSTYQQYSCKVLNSQGEMVYPYSVYLCSMSESLYRYWTTIYLTQTDVFAEPVTIYTNVTNGYGVVAARNVVREIFFVDDIPFE